MSTRTRAARKTAATHRYVHDLEQQDLLLDATAAAREAREQRKEQLCRPPLYPAAGVGRTYRYVAEHCVAVGGPRKGVPKEGKRVVLPAGSGGETTSRQVATRGAQSGSGMSGMSREVAAAVWGALGALQRRLGDLLDEQIARDDAAGVPRDDALMLAMSVRLAPVAMGRAMAVLTQATAGPIGAASTRAELDDAAIQVVGAVDAEIRGALSPGQRPRGLFRSATPAAILYTRHHAVMLVMYAVQPAAKAPHGAGRGTAAARHTADRPLITYATRA